MNIAILGVGNVGVALGGSWARKGHLVVFGVRDPASRDVSASLARIGGKARAASVADAAAAGEIVALAVPWPAVPDALRAAGNLAGKILFDCTNPLLPDLSGLDVGLTTSAGEKVAALAPGARVVKIFNTTGSGNMADSAYGSERPTMFYCGDDPSAKTIAGQLAAEIGFDPIDAGPLRQARLLEPYALLWISLAVQRGLGTGIAFKLMRR
ncbi:MAG: NADPH-dependent F420 reductase [Pseudomonadota bacterium]